MPQMLSVEYSNKGGNTQIQVYRNNNGTLVAFGNPYTPGTALPADATGTQKTNLAVQFGEYFYCSAGNEIRRYNPATQNWDAEVTAYATTSGNSSSLLVGIGPTGTPRLAIVYRSTQVAVRTLDVPGGAWSAEVLTGLAVSGSAWPFSPPITFNNEYLLTRDSLVVSWAFDGSGANIQTVGNIIQAPHHFTRVGTRLFALTGPNGAATAYYDVWERIGGTWALVLSGLVNQVMPRFGAATSSIPNGLMFYDAAADMLIVISHLDDNTAAALGTPGVGLAHTNPGGDGLHAVGIPISMIGKAAIGPDAVGTGFEFAATTITRNDGGSWITDGVEVGSFIRVESAEDGANVETWGPVTGVTAGIVTIATAGFTVNADDTTAVFYLREHNLTGAIITGGLQPPTGVDPLGDSRFSVERDTETDPTNPITYFWACSANTAQQRYQYNGIATPITVMGTGGDRGIALTHNPQGGGEAFYGGSTTAAPSYHVEEAAEPVPLNNASRIFLRGKIFDETGGAPTATDEEVGLYFSADDGPTADTLATITNAALVSGPGNAPSIAANKLTMTFDNVSIYSVEWQAVADGLVDQQQHLMMPRAEV